MTEFADLSPDDLAVAELYRSLTPEDFELVAPPPGLWAAIEAETQTQTQAQVEATENAAHVAARQAPPTSQTPRSEPTSRAQSAVRAMSRRGVVRFTAVAAVAALALVGFVAARRLGADPERQLALVELTTAGLETPEPTASGTAELVEEGGHQVLHLHLDRVTARSGEYLELWLIDTEVSGMVSLGTARDGAEYPLPAGLSISEYPIIDVSSEPYDGDPAHSSRSLVRGVVSI
ncbi:MAG: anti-sigma factor [Ilumatobacteraceae bacterium]